MKLWKWLLLAVLIITSLFLVTPLDKKVRLGLDLQGGYSFTVELDRQQLEENLRDRNPEDTDDEIAQRMADTIATANETAVEIIRNRIDSLGTEEPVITKGKDGRIYVQIPGASAEQRDRAEKMIKDNAFLEFRLVSTRSAEKADKLFERQEAPAGFKISSIGGGDCYTRDATVKDVDFRALRSFGNPEPGYAFMLEKDVVGQVEVYRPIYVERRARMTGESLKKAGVSTDDMGNIVVNLSFDAQGTRDFAKLTRKYAATDSRPGRQLAVVLDDVCYSAPVLREAITGGHAQISGSFNMVDATILKNVLNAGAMPAPLRFLGKRFVNPTLGEDSIADSKGAIVIGCALVLAFMVFYYHRMGVVADVALILNFVLLPLAAVLASGILSQFTSDATLSGGSLLRLPVLTMPGIAGLLLSVGMAVDANVLIYERTREELALGRPTKAAVLAGYDRAFGAIFDGNITTIITGIILFIFGTGLVRGFAVTLVAGIIVSMFTALFVTRLIFQTCVKEDTKWRPGMLQLVPPTVNIPFLANAGRFATLAVVIIVATLAVTVFRGVKNPASIFGVDFTGGAKVTYSVAAAEGAEMPDLGAVRAALNNAGVDDAEPQIQKDEANTYLEVKTVLTELDGVEISEVMTKALQNADNADLKGATFTYLDVDSIGSQIGKEMKRTAAIAIALSTLAMLIYIGFRFEFGFGLGAIVALVHDVLITTGIFSCLGFQFNLTIVAAMLTIVGYGVNDTIVLFDRVREEIKRDQKSGFRDLVNHCINVTLARTVLTTITTLLPILALIICCSGEIRGFAVCMLIGMTVSTFSTVFIASPVMLAYYHNKRPDFRAK